MVQHVFSLKLAMAAMVNLLNKITHKNTAIYERSISTLCMYGNKIHILQDKCKKTTILLLTLFITVDISSQIAAIEHWSYHNHPLSTRFDNNSSVHFVCDSMQKQGSVVLCHSTGSIHWTSNKWLWIHDLLVERPQSNSARQLHIDQYLPTAYDSKQIETCEESARYSQTAREKSQRDA